MTYLLNFALKLSRDSQKDSSVVIYDPESFVDKPIKITTETVRSIIKNLIANCTKVSLTDKKAESKGAEKSSKDSSISQDDSKLKPPQNKAYICQVKELQKKELNQIYNQIVESFKEKLENLSSETLLDPENYDFSDMQELIALRNYLITYVDSKKKKYSDGCIYIFED